MQDLTALSDCQLAALQMAGINPGSTQWELCEQEVTRRRGVPAVQRAWIAIWIFMGGLVLAAFALAIVLPKQVLVG